MSAVDITVKSNEAYGLTMISEEATYMQVYQWLETCMGQSLYVFVYSDPGAAHGPTTETGSPHSSQPLAGDSLYEPV